MKQNRGKMRLELAYECFPDTNLTGVMHLAYQRNFALVELSELLIGALNLDLVLHKRLLNELIAETRFILLALWGSRRSFWQRMSEVVKISGVVSGSSPPLGLAFGLARSLDNHGSRA
jgi:hypothetical protein